MSLTSDNTKRVFPILDTILEMQRFGLRAMTLYQPVASAFLDSALSAERGAASSFFVSPRDRAVGAPARQDADAEHVVAIGEEVLNVGTRTVPGKTTRVRRVVVEAPVQQDITLHTETVVVERRRPNTSIGQDVLTEVTMEMSDSNEVPVVSKSVRLVEEVLLRKEVTARIETIRDTVKRDTLEIEQPSQLPVVFNAPKQPVVFDAAKQQEDKMHDEKRAREAQDKKVIVPVQADTKTGDQKRQAPLA
jgi:stress response protein YsnF